MALKVEISVRDNGLITQLEQFPNSKNAAISRAINRTAGWVKTQMKRQATAALTVNKVGDIAKSLTASRSTPEKLLATVKIGGNRIPLIFFRGKPTKAPNGKRLIGGVSYQIRASEGRKSIEHNAFVANVGGKMGFFKRSSFNIGHEKVIAKTGKRAGKYIWSQRKINQLMGISVATALEGSPEFKKLVEVDTQARLQLQLDREANFLLTGTSKLPAEVAGG